MCVHVCAHLHVHMYICMHGSVTPFAWVNIAHHTIIVFKITATPFEFFLISYG